MTDKGQVFYKGFDENMQCCGFQYVEGETYTHDGDVKLCHEGFHACEIPLDCLTYYPLKDGSQYHQVTLGGVSDRTADDSKRVGKTITVGAKLNLSGLIQAHVEVVKEKAKNEPGTHAATSGHSANAATSGHYAHAATSGDYAHAATSGDYANAATSGHYAHAATSGDSANAATSGHYAHAATTGDYAHAATSGHYANAATTGYSARVRSSVHDPDAVAAVLGEGAARGVKGSWLVLTERDIERGLKEVRAVQVDGETVKAGVYYTLQNGKLVEVGE